MHENKYPLVTHPRDPRFLILRSLQTSLGRSRTGLYIIEGIRHLARAVEHGAQIQSIFLEPSVLSNPFGQKLTRRLRSRGRFAVFAEVGEVFDARVYRLGTKEWSGNGRVIAERLDGISRRSITAFRRFF